MLVSPFAQSVMLNALKSSFPENTVNDSYAMVFIAVPLAPLQVAAINPAPGPAIDDQAVATILKALALQAKAKGVTLLVETNGAYADTARLARLLDAVGSDAVAALWDIHHPFRFFRESPETTMKNLDGRIDQASASPGSPGPHRAAARSHPPRRRHRLRLHRRR